MAGLPGAVSATLNDHVLTFLNRARKIELGPLAVKDMAAYYRAAFAELGIVADDELCLAAAEATKGSPYMLQLVGHNVVLRLTSGNALTQETLRLAVADSREDYETDVCETTTAALSEVDCAFLRAMSNDSGESSVAEVAQRMGVTYDYAQKYRRRLIDAGVIRASSRGKVAFAVPYLADYLRREE